jgi:hypothetical protein
VVLNDEPSPIELVAIARGLEDEGRYLAARLFRAAARSEETRRSAEHPRSNADIAQAIDAIAPRLERVGHAPALAAAMRRVAAMLRSGEDRFDADMAEVHVCRGCGWEMVGPMLDECPGCGAGALSFAHVLPIYFLEPLPAQRLVAMLAAYPERVVEVCRGVSDEQAATGEWPLLEILSHLVGAQRLLGARVVRTLTEDEPQFRSVASTAVTAGGTRPSAADLIAVLRTEREALVGRLAPLAADQWQRAGFHGEWGRITIQEQLSYLARHEDSHLSHLKRAAGAR